MSTKLPNIVTTWIYSFLIMGSNLVPVIYSSSIPPEGLCRECWGNYLLMGNLRLSSLFPCKPKLATWAICEIMEENKKSGKHFFPSAANKHLACIYMCSNLCLAWSMDHVKRSVGSSFTAEKQLMLCVFVCGSKLRGRAATEPLLL